MLSIVSSFIQCTAGQETLGYIHLLKLICCHPWICYSNIQQKVDYQSLYELYPEDYQQQSTHVFVCYRRRKRINSLMIHPKWRLSIRPWQRFLKLPMNWFLCLVITLKYRGIVWVDKIGIGLYCSGLDTGSCRTHWLSPFRWLYRHSKETTNRKSIQSASHASTCLFTVVTCRRSRIEYYGYCFSLM